MNTRTEMVAGDIMSQDLLTVSEHWSIQTLIDFFNRHKVTGAPVLSSKREFIGVVSLSDILTFDGNPSHSMNENPTTQYYYNTLEGISPDELGLSDGDQHKNHLVAEIMTRSIISASDTTPVTELAETMHSKGGAQITAACANQMNPPLSYISANQISSYKVVAGISPVSAGGDNIAGVIAVNSISPQYSESKQLGWHSGYVSAQYNTLDNGKKVGAGMRIASDVFSFNYQGAFSDANSYEDGNGDLVLDTLYRAQNHSLSAAMRDDKQQLVVKLSHQKIPYQGFANQYMDMTDNTSYGAVAQYKRTFTNSELEAQLNWHNVKHEMGFFSAEKPGKMPMKTDAEDISTQLKWRLALDNNSQLLLAQEYHHMKLDDWWPAVEGFDQVTLDLGMLIHV